MFGHFGAARILNEARKNQEQLSKEQPEAITKTQMRRLFKKSGLDDDAIKIQMTVSEVAPESIVIIMGKPYKLKSSR
jgi:hypothetical protein